MMINARTLLTTHTRCCVRIGIDRCYPLGGGGRPRSAVPFSVLAFGGTSPNGDKLGKTRGIFEARRHLENGDQKTAWPPAGAGSGLQAASRSHEARDISLAFGRPKGRAQEAASHVPCGGSRRRCPRRGFASRTRRTPCRAREAHGRERGISRAPRRTHSKSRSVRRSRSRGCRREAARRRARRAATTASRCYARAGAGGCR